jgi:predicted tellurium resistance membrane protein TerC
MMSKIGGSGLLLAGIFLALFGLFIGSNFVEGLLDFIKWILVIIGVILGVVGLLQVFKGGSESSSQF